MPDSNSDSEISDKVCSEEYVWPERGDRVAQTLGQGSEHYIPKCPSERALFIWSGFFRAAELLAEQAECDRLDQAHLIYPIMFCYRHAIEVSLKYLIEEYGSMVDVSLPKKKDHNLIELWKLHEKLADHFGTDNEANIAVGVVVKDFHELDRSGFNFRYATDPKGGAIEFKSGLVSLSALKKVMKKVEHFFDGSTDYYYELKTAGP
jgi:hypothetical protein